MENEAFSGIVAKPVRPLATACLAILYACDLCACDKSHTSVVLDNHTASVVYRASWQAVTFPAPVAPGASSDPQASVAASANTAYVVLAPGWDLASDAGPTSFVVLQSREGFELHFDGTLHIPVDDDHFIGSCDAGSKLTQEQADFITQRLFSADFMNLHYDAATCTVTGP